MNDNNEAPNEAPATPAAQPAEPDPFAVIEKLNAENAELKDRVLRGLAEMENLRRRTEREIADARAYGVANLARDMLTVADNLARTLQAVPAGAREADPALQALVEGVELTERDLQAALGRHGVTKLSPQGEKFDPNFHQAMFEMPHETVPAGAVAEVIQAGWKIAERVLRPALVGVSKGAAKVAPKNDGDAPAA
jgi:molecular chaperone GrpE